MVRKAHLVFAGLCVAAAATSAQAAAVTFASSSGLLAASADFSVSGNNLVVQLTNTSTADVTANSQILQAIFFKVTPTVTLTPVSAQIGTGSTLIYASSQPSGGLLNDFWAYKQSGISIGGGDRGISSVGFGLFGPPDTFNPGVNSQPGGQDYGILSAGDNIATTQGALGKNPLVKNSMVFTLSGLPTNFDLGTISNVSFQYGTAINNVNDPLVPAVRTTPIPEASTAALLAPAAMLLGGRRRRA